MEPGDLLVLYSDGVTEAANLEGEEFEDRLPELAARLRDRPAPEVVQAIHEAVKVWIAGQPPADDVTVVVARRASTEPRA
jgi:serine phosphatase RsbU (regulator of sigma subunit)